MAESEKNDAVKLFEPPTIHRWVYIIRFICPLIILPAVLDHLCLNFLKLPVCIVIVLLFIMLGLLYTERIFSNEYDVHQERLEDEDDVRATFVDVENAEPRLIHKNKKYPDNYDEKLKNLKSAKEQIENDGTQAWTETRIYPLSQLNVDFLKIDDLRARSLSALAWLEEYAKDSKHSYDRDQFTQWNDKIKNAIKSIDEVNPRKDLEIDKRAEPLRAYLRDLYEHVASYEADWSRGVAFLRNVIISVGQTIIILLAVCLIAIGDKMIIFWGLLGIVGSLIAVLQELKRTDSIEVGNERGKRELWRTFVGAVLGLSAGIILYSMIKANLIYGPILPTLKDFGPTNVALSIVWAISAGFSFEKVFDRLKGNTFDNL